MGKRQHQKDKMYITYTEWSTLYGGKKPGTEITFRKLPFDHCCVSLQPFENPCCDRDGNIFELEAVALFLKKFKLNPVTGKPQDFKSLIKLNISKNKEGKYQCPVLFKQFTPGSHIVAVAVTGNVFSYEAVEELNIKGKSWKDLISGETFKRSDLIILQDPGNLEKFNLTNFHHIKNNLTVEDEVDPSAQGGRSNLKTVSKEAQDILNELDREYKPPEVKKEDKPIADKFNAAHYSTGAVAASFTSTSLAPETRHEPAIIEEDLVRYEHVTKKGYVRLVTNLGPLNLELHCDLVPKTCENFIKHCQRGYYNGTIFHRSIRHFMIQGGDPTGTGTGGESIWGKPFENEIKPQLTHTGRGILSMANSGPNTNGSQFFITYRSCQNLNGKHSVFGHVVGGLDTLSAMEKIEVDNKDRPIEDIVVTNTHVFIDPYQEADDALAAKRATELKKEEETESKKKRGGPLRVFRSGVGKYIDPESVSSTNEQNIATEPSLKKKRKVGYLFGNFEQW